MWWDISLAYRQALWRFIVSNSSNIVGWSCKNNNSARENLSKGALIHATACLLHHHISKALLRHITRCHASRLYENFVIWGNSNLSLLYFPKDGEWRWQNEKSGWAITRTNVLKNKLRGPKHFIFWNSLNLCIYDRSLVWNFCFLHIGSKRSSQPRIYPPTFAFTEVESSYLVILLIQ